MGLIKTILERHRKKVQERNNACAELLLRVDEALRDAESMFSDTSAFVDPLAETEWRNCHNSVLADWAAHKTQRLKKAQRYKELLAKSLELSDVACSMSRQILGHNESAASLKLPLAYSLIGDVEGRKLDAQQMVCIVKEVRNHLVIAGAGTGKTTTVVGKIKYLLKSGQCLPQDILVLSFTNASAAEMSERIAAETGCSIAASTFHKLGVNIITKVNGVKPRITRLDLRKFVKEQLELNMRSDAYLNLLSSYLLYNRVVAKSEFEFSSAGEYEEYLKLNPPKTLNGEAVKSYGEMDIANFLAQNGIRYVYEAPYEVDTRTSEHGQYHPDFYLPDYKIYIEYFGINREGEVPSYFEAKDGMTASEAYRASMEWKRATHQEHQTAMIECYAYEKLEGILLDSLKEKLEAASVALKPKSPKELWAQVGGKGDALLDGLVELLETLINLIKSNRYDIPVVSIIFRKFFCKPH